MRQLVFSAPYRFLPESLMAELRRHFDVHLMYRAPWEAQMQRLQEADVWIVSTAPERFIGADVLGACRRLAVLATPSTGWTHVDVDAVRQRGIHFLSIRDSPVLREIRASSEFTFALVLSLVRNLPSAFREVSEGRWRDKEAALRGHELYGKTLGVVGCGRIGSNMCRYATAFGMRALASDPHVDPSTCPAALVSMRELLATADIVCLCAHLSPETRGLFDAGCFAAMKRGAWFVNTSRGELVDEAALLDALRSGHLSGAALDVIQDEQHVDFVQSPLLRYAREHSNLVVSPHVAGLTYESEMKAASAIVGQVLDHYHLGDARA